MLTNLDTLLLTCKQAEARHETAYAFVELLPSHDPDAEAWAPLWAKLRELRLARDVANAAYFAGLAQQREAIRLAGAGTYTVSFIAEAPAGSTALAA